MYHICIVDDERKAAEILELLLIDCIKEDLSITLFTCPKKALNHLKKTDTDLLFLDIKMPILSGFDLLQALPLRNFKVIFTTAYDQYAIQAIKLQAFDYLLKPIDEEELAIAFQRFLKSNTEEIELIQLALDKIKVDEVEPSKKISISSLEKTYYFDMKQIIRCEAYGNYTTLYFTDHSKLISSKTLLEYDKILTPNGFIRIHKSHLVNSIYIKALNGKSEVEMIDHSVLPVARRRKREVLQFLSEL